MNERDAERVYRLVSRVIAATYPRVLEGKPLELIYEARTEFFEGVNSRLTEERLAAYERILRLVLRDVNSTLGFADSLYSGGQPPSTPFGLDYRSLKYMIDEALK